jgi:integrase
MLKADLTEAGIAYVDDAGRKADFHAVRHTLATELDRTGASLKERMTITRRSDKSSLTLGTYTHVQTYDPRRAMENLPDHPRPGTE